MPSLSIIVPTADPSRPLNRMLSSLVPQLGSEDEVIIVGDTFDNELPTVERLCQYFGSQVRYEPFNAGQHAWGHPQLNRGISLARGDFLVFNDDDDVFTMNALESIRREVSTPVPHMFRFLAYSGLIRWGDRKVEEGNVGGHCFVTPNIPSKLGTWSDRYQGDFDFITSTLALWPPGSLKWCEALIAVARPTIP